MPYERTASLVFLAMRLHTGKRLSPLLMLLAQLAVASGAQAGAIGTFTEVAGDVTLLRGQQYYRAAEGVEVEGADLVETGADGGAQIELLDGSILRLAAGGRILLSEYELGRDQGVVAASLEVLRGWLRFAVTKLQPGASYAFNTPVLVVGIRGTEGVIDAANEQSAVSLEEGMVEVRAHGAGSEALAPLRLVAGEFVQRREDGALERLRAPPAGFRARLPASMQARAERRLLRLRRRGVAAPPLRRASPADVQRYLRDHPALRERLERRLLRPQPGAQPPSEGARQPTHRRPERGTQPRRRHTDRPAR